MATDEIEYDDDLLADAQKILGTGSPEETFRAAMRQVLRDSPPFNGTIPVVDGAITLPQQIVVRYDLDTEGAAIEFTERKDGVIQMRPVGRKD